MNRLMHRAAQLRGLPGRSELFDAIGLEPRRSARRSAAEGATLFLLGVLVGGLVALLLAPESGAELRSRLRANGGADDDLAEAGARD